MREDQYDIIFDAPHFNAWRMKHLGHIPVATLPNQLHIHLINLKEYVNIKTTEDLVGRAICATPSPNFATDHIFFYLLVTPFSFTFPFNCYSACSYI